MMLPGTRGAFVIVVEDSRALALMAAELLTELEYRVIARWTGFEDFASGTYFRGAPDLLIIDLMLTDTIGGIQVAERLRQAGCTCPMIALSGDRKLLTDAMATGQFVDTLYKPEAFAPKTFARTVERALLRGSGLHNPTDQADGE